MTIIAYARFSSTGQIGGSSIERQFEAAKAFAAERGWSIDEFVSDEARSAFHGHHKTAGQLGQILERAVQGQLGRGDTIIVENIDRLSREKITDAMTTLLALMNAGVSVVTLHDQRVLTKANYDSQIGHMVETLFKIGAANDESEKKRQRQNANWERWRAEGKLTFKAPFWMNQQKQLVPDRHAVLKRMFDLAEAGQGSATIAATLKREGIKSFGTAIGDKTKTKETFFTPATIAHLLRNRSVLGEYQPKSAGEAVGPVVVDYYPQAITHDQFNRVQQSLSTRKFREYGSGKTGQGNMLKSVLHCAYCRERMILSGKRDQVAYRCRMAVVKGCENRRLWNREKLDQALLTHIREIGVKDRRPPRLVELEAEKAKVESNIETAKENADRFALLWSKEPESETLRNRFKSYETEAKELAERLVEIEREASLITNPADSHSQAVKLIDAYLTINDEDKRDFRSRMNVLLQNLVRTMFVDDLGSLIFQLNDGTTYRMQYELRPDAAPRKVGSRPLTDYHWRAIRTTMQEAVEEHQRQLEAYDGPRLEDTVLAK